MHADEMRAQRWHDTDHGDERGEPLRSNQFRVAVNTDITAPVSSCWCCCWICDADDNRDGRFNPYWTRAVQAWTPE